MKGSAASAQVADPYAEALMSLAKDSNLVDPFGEDASSVIETLEGSDELVEFLSSPVHPADQKKAVLKQLFEGKVQGHFLSFLQLLVDRQRISYLGGICNRYRELLRDLKNVVLAEVTSAIELNDGQRNAVVEKVKTMTGAESVELQSSVDSDLIGGVIIKIGSQVVDASLRGQLRRIALDLSA